MVPPSSCISCQAELPKQRILAWRIPQVLRCLAHMEDDAVCSGASSPSFLSSASSHGVYMEDDAVCSGEDSSWRRGFENPNRCHHVTEAPARYRTWTSHYPGERATDYTTGLSRGHLRVTRG